MNMKDKKTLSSYLRDANEILIKNMEKSWRWTLEQARFIQYVYRERDHLRKVMDKEQQEANKVKEVVEYIDAIDREMRRTRNVSLKEMEMNETRLGFTHCYLTPEKVAPAPQFRDDAKEVK